MRATRDPLPRPALRRAGLPHRSRCDPGALVHGQGCAARDARLSSRGCGFAHGAARRLRAPAGGGHPRHRALDPGGAAAHRRGGARLGHGRGGGLGGDMKRRSLIIGLLLSAVFLYLAVRKVDLHEVWRHLAAADYWLLIPASLLTLLSLWIRAYRWGVLLAPLQRIGAGTLFSATSIGFMCNNILPMRLGELIRAFVLRRATGVRASAAFATIIVERLFDLFAMVGIFGVLVVLAPFENRQVKMSLLFALILGVIVLGGLLVFYLRGETFEALARRLLPARVRERVAGMVGSFSSGLDILRDVPRMLWVGALTLLMWLCIVLVIEICFSASHLEAGAASLPATASLFVLVVMAIGVMVPSGPGFVGTLQAAAVLGLFIVGYRDQARAFSFSIVYHASQWFPVTLIGFVYLMREQLSLAQIGRISSREDLVRPERQATGLGAEAGGERPEEGETP
ncbi:MAG: flippase-like domain-containing protein [Candidatus Eisenbacteria bacterium]|nr:flippase-like domain-containing protein [Candidatus Eisenbacteria bacterium]